MTGIRSWTLIWPLFLLNSCQILKGSYCTPPNYTASCIQFQSKKELLYHQATDYGPLFMDYGQYFIKRDTLIVHFMEMPEIYKLKSGEGYEVIEYREWESDSVEINLHFTGVPFAQAVCRDESGAIISGHSVQKDKALNMKIPASALPFNLHASYWKSEVAVPIIKTGYYEISITLDELTGKANYNRRIGTRSKYFIKESRGIPFLEEAGNGAGGRFYKKE